MEILVEKLKADKKLLVAETVGLTDAEGKAFWPIYDACQAELDGINKRLKAGIRATRRTTTRDDDRREGGGDADRDVRHRRSVAGVEEVAAPRS